MAGRHTNKENDTGQHQGTRQNIPYSKRHAFHLGPTSLLLDPDNMLSNQQTSTLVAYSCTNCLRFAIYSDFCTDRSG